MSIHPIDYRYGSQEMKEIFEEEKKLEYQLKVESALSETLSQFGIIPKSSAQIIKKRANLKFVKLKRVKEIEKKVKHEVVALVLALSEVCGKAKKYVHLTATSYDILDTALALQLKEATKILLKKGKKLLKVCLKICQSYKDLIMVGRTHGQHALPITLGFKFANFAHQIGESLIRVRENQKYILGKFSGAVGTQASQKILNLPENFEDKLLKKLGLKKAEISTQVVARENLARVLADIVILAGTLEKIAKEIRNLQRTEIFEIAEPFSEKQVGSSAMPQKRNPWQSENICSNVKIIRSCILPCLENIALEHERDLTNSAAERTILPTIFVLMDDILERMTKILENLEVFPENMEKNLKLSKGRIFAEAILSQLVKKGAERQKSHQLLKELSFKAEREKREFKEVLMESKEIQKYLSQKEIEKVLQPENYLGFAIKKTEKIIKKWNSFLRQICL